MANFPIEVITRTVEVVGEVLVAYTVIRVHSRLVKEHRIDKQVIAEIVREQTFAKIGILLIVLAYFMDIFT
jgi:hypothetical protein